MNKIIRISLALAFAALAIAQTNTLTSTTLSAAQTSTQTYAVVASGTNFTTGDALYIDNEIEIIGGRLPYPPYAAYAGGTTVPVFRSGSQGAAQASAHVSGAIVLRGKPAWFYTYDPSGACPVPFTNGGVTPAAVFTTPWVNTKTGSSWRCTAGQWGKVGMFFVAPGDCNFAPTTLTQTTTYVLLGTSNMPVANSVTNAAAGTDTIVCTFIPPSDVTSGRGSLLTDLTIGLGSQVVAPTSIGTATFGTVTLPTPVATTQTASVLAPVSAGGTVTQLGPTTTVLSVTTAGRFLSFNYSVATPIDLTPDLQLVQFTLPVLQSAASAMTINTNGLFVHYIHRQ
jgi:hypothetical protein